MATFSLFDERKAAQAAACLLHLAGGDLPLLKLVKLLYLSERLSLKRYGDTITGDSFYSLPHGPVLSATLDLMNGFTKSKEGGWETWVADRADNMLALRDVSMVRTPEDDLLALSDTDLECLSEVWTEFGHWDRWKLVEYTHSDACPEWEEPIGAQRSRILPLTRILKAVGYSSEDVETLNRRLHEQRYVNAAFH